jgi:hypothetical protein
MTEVMTTKCCLDECGCQCCLRDIGCWEPCCIDECVLGCPGCWTEGL